MKLIVPTISAIGLASAHVSVKDDCKDLSSRHGMSKCLQAVIADNKKTDKAMNKKMDELEDMLEEKNVPQPITVEGDYYSGTCDDDQVTENCPNPFGEVPNMTIWTMKEYHYYMNCKDEVHVRTWNEKLEWDARNPGKPYLPLDSGKFPNLDVPEDTFWLNCPSCNFTNKPEVTLSMILNEGAIPNPGQDSNPWAWMEADYFFYLVSDHGVEMMSWGSDEYKDYWRMRNNWYNDDIAEWQKYIWGYEQNQIFKYCSALPKTQMMWGIPQREAGSNPKYPYTSWRNEGFDSTVEEADANFRH